METLKKLTKIVNRYSQKNLDILLVESKSKTKIDILYEALHSDQIDSEEEGMELIYGHNHNKNSQGAFTKLKYRLRDKLIDSIFLIDFSKTKRTDYEKAKIRVAKAWSASRIFEALKLLSLSRKVMEPLLITCNKYELTRFKMLILDELIAKYTLETYDKKKLENYKQKWEQSLYEYTLSQKIYNLYLEIGRHILSNERRDYTEEINDLEKRLDSIYDDVLDINLVLSNLNAFESKYILLEYKDERQAQLKICDDALAAFYKKRFDLLPLFRFHQKRGVTLVRLERFSEGLSEFKCCIDMLTVFGNLRWHLTNSYILSTHLFKKDYVNVYKTLSDVIYHKDFKKLASEYKEGWYLKEALVQFMVLIGLINPDDIDVKPLRKFRLSRFVNEVHVMTKDKTGSNVTLYILQLLFLITSHNTESSKKKLAAVRQYSYRHMQHPDFNRTKLFIKMLSLYIKYDYDVGTVEQKSKKLYEELLASKPQIKERMMATAFIPYDVIWQGIIHHERRQSLATN